MKKRLCAGLLAFLCCMQSGAVLNASAEEATEGTQKANILAGDVNLDNTINVLDVITLNRVILGKDILTSMQNQTADMNQDNIIDSSDSLEIMKQIVGLNQ